MKKALIFSILTASCLLLSSCKGSDTETQTEILSEPVISEETFSQPDAETIEETHDGVYYTLPEHVQYSSEGIECEPIDKSLDCEAILLEKADRLKTLMTDYLNLDEEKLAYKLGEPYYNENGMIVGSKVISDEMSCYADFKAMFSDCVYGKYLDSLCTSGNMLFDINDELCCSGFEGSYLGTDETWYLGYDVQDDRIIGHFAELRGMGEPQEHAAEYLNDESNYRFYDITVQCVDGVYVITDCRETTSGKSYDYSMAHGFFYNSGFADRSLITNERVKPKFQSVFEEGSCQTEEAQTIESSDLNSIPWKYLEGENPTEIVSNALIMHRELDYTKKMEVISAEISDSVTQRYRQMWLGSEAALENGWSDDFINQNMVGVLALYYCEYDHTKCPYVDGYCYQQYYLVQNPDTGLWMLYDWLSPSSHDSFEELVESAEQWR